MKEIKAIVQPFMLEHVLDALDRIGGLPGVTVSEVVGYGKPHGRDAREAHEPPSRASARKTKLELVVSDEMAPGAIDAIARAAHTGNPGDGKIFVLEVGEVLKIRTGERGAGAI